MARKNKQTKSKSDRDLSNQDPIFLACYELLRARIDKKKISADDVVIFAVQGMQVVERYPQLSGPEKKQLVIDLSKQIVSDLKMIDESKRDTINFAIDMVLPTVIDQIIAATRGELDINKIVSKCSAGIRKLVSSCKGCCKKEQ